MDLKCGILLHINGSSLSIRGILRNGPGLESLGGIKDECTGYQLRQFFVEISTDPVGNRKGYG